MAVEGKRTAYATTAPRSCACTAPQYPDIGETKKGTRARWVIVLAQAAAKSLPRHLAHHAVRPPMHVGSIAAAGSGVTSVRLQGNYIARDGGEVTRGGRDASTCVSEVSGRTIWSESAPNSPEFQREDSQSWCLVVEPAPIQHQTICLY